MPKLRELQAALLGVVIEKSTEVAQPGELNAGMYVWRDKMGEIVGWSPSSESTRFVTVETVAEANGIRFLCPKSFAKNGGPKGTHSVYIFFQGSPYAGRNKDGKEVRWTVVGGTTIDDLQLSPSILEQDEGVKNPCGWHGFVGTNGVPPGHAA